MSIPTAIDQLFTDEYLVKWYQVRTRFLLALMAAGYIWAIDLPDQRMRAVEQANDSLTAAVANVLGEVEDLRWQLVGFNQAFRQCTDSIRFWRGLAIHYRVDAALGR